MVLGVGIDWAEAFHLVALGRPAEGVIELGRVEHTPAAVDQLIAQIATLEPDPAEVRVVIETPHGLLVERLVDAGFVALPVNPDLVARRRGPARKKDDAEDARIACLLGPRPPHQPAAAHPAWGAGRRAARHRPRRRARRQRPAAAAQLAPPRPHLDLPDRAGDRWRRPGRPDHAAAAGALANPRPARQRLPQELVAFARAGRHGWPDRCADRIAQALAADHFTPRDDLVRAKADTIRLAATQLLAIGAQRKAWERRMGALLLGAPRRGRAKQPRQEELGEAFPGGEVYLSFPGLGDRLAARVAGEIGDHPQQFGSPNALACYAGKAQVTRRPGKSELVVATRLACNRYLADAVQQWAFCSLRRSGWAREFYDAQRGRGKTHHAALRALGNRWLEILWHCLIRGQPYDEATHTANRNRALGKAAQPRGCQRVSHGETWSARWGPPGGPPPGPGRRRSRPGSRGCGGPATRPRRPAARAGAGPTPTRPPPRTAGRTPPSGPAAATVGPAPSPRRSPGGGPGW